MIYIYLISWVMKNKDCLFHRLENPKQYSHTECLKKRQQAVHCYYAISIGLDGALME